MRHSVEAVDSIYEEICLTPVINAVSSETALPCC